MGYKDDPIYKFISEVPNAPVTAPAVAAPAPAATLETVVAAPAAPAAPAAAVAEPVAKAFNALVALKAAQLPSRKSQMEELGVIYGIGAGANIDKDNEALKARDMILMAHDFCARDSRTFKANHKDNIKCDLVESVLGRPILKSGTVLKAGDAIPEGDEVIGFDAMGEATHWFLAVKPHDPEIVAAAKAGSVSGFSWGAMVNKTEVVGA